MKDAGVVKGMKDKEATQETIKKPSAAVSAALGDVF
jgi:hypothetical protein